MAARVRAQRPEATRRIGILMGYAESDSRAQSFSAAFVQGLRELGWTEGRNVRLDYRWAAGDVDRIRAFARELAALQPDVISANTTPVTKALHQETRTIPIVFAIVSDPVGEGLVASLPGKGGNVTGFINIEASMGGKWLELLKEIAPSVKRAAIIFNPDTAPGGGSYFSRSFEAAARSLAVEPATAAVRSDVDIERVIADLGREPVGGLVLASDGFIFVQRAPIIALAARHKVPAIYGNSQACREGGLLSYGPDISDKFRRAAPYVDCILRGAKTAELPVQVPTKFELVINLKAAKALGLTVPLTLLATTNEVIE
jgi:putative ABC transport system substrate-binding protein